MKVLWLRLKLWYVNWALRSMGCSHPAAAEAMLERLVLESELRDALRL